ncbi:putative adhesin, partial [Streptomyces sp. MUM 16J]|uniref:putative adhesin n=1 Tax=Streptomyces sp. MUM 16J TaxID=2791988 RepID=UPI001F044129
EPPVLSPTSGNAPITSGKTTPSEADVAAEARVAAPKFGDPLRGKAIPTYGKGVGPAAERIPGGRPDGQTVIAGHGSYVRGTGDMQMPSGTWGYFYVEDGVGLKQSKGLAVEQGEKVRPTEIVGPGRSLPNYTVSPGDDLKMMSGSITVSKDTLLSEILKPNMGPVHISICRKHCDPWR